MTHIFSFVIQSTAAGETGMRFSTDGVFDLRGVCDQDEGEAGPFVLNLCSVPGHISIPQPRAPGLSRYAFFVSRGVEGNHEQCWLHMGYFASRLEAEKWLEILHRVYPMAFVTPAPLTFVPQDVAPGRGAVLRLE